MITPHLTLLGPESIPWNGAHGSFSVANLSPGNPLTLVVTFTNKPSETINLNAYGDSFSTDPYQVSTISLSATTYPASVALALTSVLGVTLTPYLSGAPGSTYTPGPNITPPSPQPVPDGAAVFTSATPTPADVTFPMFGKALQTGYSNEAYDEISQRQTIDLLTGNQVLVAATWTTISNLTHYNGTYGNGGVRLMGGIVSVSASGRLQLRNVQDNALGWPAVIYDAYLGANTPQHFSIMGNGYAMLQNGALNDFIAAYLSVAGSVSVVLFMAQT